MTHEARGRAKSGATGANHDGVVAVVEDLAATNLSRRDTPHGATCKQSCKRDIMTCKGVGGQVTNPQKPAERIRSGYRTGSAGPPTIT